MTRGAELGKVEARRGGFRLDDELFLSGLMILAITILYLMITAALGVPAASGLFGHWIGIMGFGLMLTTETLYSWRKRTRGRTWGRMSTWLKFHIFTGLVGPYLVFLHSAWKFHGLAGITLLMTAIVVVSGFFGRYIYTAVPRTVDGVILERAEVLRRLDSAEAALAKIRGERAAARELRDPGAVSGMLMVLGRFFYGWRAAWRAWTGGRGLDAQARTASARVEALIRRRNELQRQVVTLAAARRLMATWHTLHVPLGLMMFSAAILHIAAAIYFATLLK
ncbi:MAG: hypothetical protein MUO23_13380 [Anaerolineales bacterium]|nr:hypothetical protein [Anaerolineales bacterium]